MQGEDKVTRPLPLPPLIPSGIVRLLALGLVIFSMVIFATDPTKTVIEGCISAFGIVVGIVHLVRPEGPYDAPNT